MDDAKNDTPADKPAKLNVSRRLTGPLDRFEYEVAQLYRAWPKPRVRKDN